MTSSAPAFLTSTTPVPLDRPFTVSWARSQGIDKRRLRAWVAQGYLLNPVHGVLHASQLRDSLPLRIGCLRLVVPEHAVITDRTAAWVHGAPMVLAPGAHLEVPPVDLFMLPGGRIRRALTTSGQRDFLDDEIVEVDGLRVTSRVRTMCDLGRHLPRKQAFAAMCALLQVSDFTLEEIQELAEHRFRGYRWVRQLRALAPLCDPRFQSPGECLLVLIWYETPGLPPFEPQYQVRGPRGFFYLDLAVPGLLWAAEYDGVEFHGPDQLGADLARRAWLRESEGWSFSIFAAADVRGDGRIASERLQRELGEARRTFATRRRVVL